eukprot:SAG31_NODE_35004_length_327_cov_0.859649_1_plen_45_part_00
MVQETAVANPLSPAGSDSLELEGEAAGADELQVSSETAQSNFGW